MSRGGVSGEGRAQTVIVDSVVSRKLLRRSNFGGYPEARFDGCNCKDVISDVVRACVGNGMDILCATDDCIDKLAAGISWKTSIGSEDREEDARGYFQLLLSSFVKEVR